MLEADMSNRGQRAASWPLHYYRVINCQQLLITRERDWQGADTRRGTGKGQTQGEGIAGCRTKERIWQGT